MPEPVQMRREPYRLQMVPLLAPDPNPALPSLGGRAIYPYTRTYRFGPQPVERELEALVLENSLTRLQVIPGLGGRVWETLSQVTGLPLFHTPQKVGLINFGLRGAWYTGGVEFNFPRGHTVTNNETVPALLRRHPNGAASIIAGNLDLAQRVCWSVGVRLEPGSSSICFDILLYNRTPLPIRYTWWINAGVPASDSLEYINGTTEVVSHFLGRREHLSESVAWPVHQGQDFRWFRECREPTSLFQLAGDERWFGFYSHQIDQGMVRVGSSTGAPGLKFWNSGQAEEGYLWGKYLTCGERYSNTELQSGRPETQMDCGVLPPHYTLRWTEVWRPVWELGGVTCASEAVAIHLAPNQGSLVLRLLADRVYPGCRVIVSPRDGSRLTFPCDLPAGHPHAIPLPLLENAEHPSIEVLNVDGTRLLSYDPPAGRSRRSVLADVLQFRPGPEPALQDMPSEELLLEAQRQERLNFPGPAQALAEKALALDPGLTGAHLLLARLDLRSGRWEAARQHCRKVLWRNPLDEWAQYFLALSFLWEGDLPKAEVEFEHTIGRSVAPASAAWFHLGELRLARRDWKGALQALEQCLVHEAGHVKALALRAAALRRLGQMEAARQAACQAAALAPLDPLVRAELWLADSTSQAASPWLWNAPEAADTYVDLRPYRNLIQDALEVACDYLTCGLLEDARHVLQATLDPAAPDPQALYMLGFLKLLAGDELSAQEDWQAAARHSGDYVFSFRREEREILQSVLRRRPQDGLAHTLLGMLETYQLNPEVALPALEQAASLRPGWDQPLRLLAACYLAQGDPARAIPYLNRALEANPENAGTFAWLDELLSAQPGGAPQRLRLWERAPASVFEDDDALAACAAALACAGRCDQALELLAGHTFFPEEGSSTVRDLFARIHMSLALDALEQGKLDQALQHSQLASAYPDHLGLSTPFIGYDSPATLLQAIVHQQRGEAQAARLSLEKAARERHRETNEAEFFSGLAYRLMGCEEEARAKFQALLDKAGQDIQWPDRDPAFAHFLSTLGKAGLERTATIDGRFAEQFPTLGWKTGIYSRILRHAAAGRVWSSEGGEEEEP